MDRNTKQTSNSRYESVERQAEVTAVSQPDEQEHDTVLAKDITVSGTLHGTGDVIVEGTVIGGIEIAGVLTVARSGMVKGPISADTVYVSGCVEGDITAKACLRLEMTGSITGDVTMRSFTIEDGGYFNGQSHMTTSDAEPVILY